MKNYILSLFALIALASCDDRLDFTTSGNKVPQAFFNANPELTDLSDSLKISLKSGMDGFDFTFTGRDLDNAVKSVRFTITGGPGVLSIGGVNVFESLPLESETYNLRFRTSEVGNYRIRFEVTDELDQVSIAEARIFVFVNLAPVASFTHNQTAIFSKYEVEFNATASKDLDRHQGGNVEHYEYYVNGAKIYRTTNPVSSWVFPAAGNYNVGLKVYDNDGIESATVTRLINVTN